jgi:hypothetical protein
MQKMTTREPDDSQWEVALTALKAVLPVEIIYRKMNINLMPGTSGRKLSKPYLLRRLLKPDAEKLQSLEDKYNDLTELLSKPKVINDQSKFQKYAKAHAEFKSIVSTIYRIPKKSCSKPKKLGKCCLRITTKNLSRCFWKRLRTFRIKRSVWNIN